MSNDTFMDIVFQSLGALRVVEMLGGQVKLPPEDLQITIEFIREVSQHEDFIEEMDKRAIEAIKDLVAVAKIAKSYQEMGEIYKQVENEFFHLEQEGEMSFEMATEEAQSNVS